MANKMRMRKFGLDKGDAKSASIDLDRDPCPTVQAKGIAGVFASQSISYCEANTPAMPSQNGKPLYRVPSMDEIRALPDTGLRVASFFAGCGGSSTGYRMAGMRVLYANDFEPHAVECYRANCADYTTVSGKDIHQVTAQEVLDACRLQPGELDVLDGSPPCQGFSTAGKRQVNDPKNTLFGEWARILEGVRPRTFVAENVSGMVKGVMKGIFLEVLAMLKEKGYRVACRVLDAQWLGVPQARQRVIFVGVRNDLAGESCHPSPLGWRYSVREACPWIGSVVHDTTGQAGAEGINSYSSGEVAARPCPAITIGAGSLNSRHFAVGEVPRVGGGGESAVLVNHPNGGFASTECLDAPMPTVTAGQCRVSVVEPADSGLSCPTVQTVPHDTPLRQERRKFTIAELRRICSFPDDFMLVGSYAQQWARLGNSVPPVMAFWVAKTLRDRVLLPLRGDGPWPHDPACLIAGR